MSKSLTPAQRRLRGQKAAFTRWSREDPAANAARGQAGLFQKFLDEVDAEDPGLPDHERQRRAEAKRRAHMAGLALASSKARATRPNPDDGEAA